MVKYFCDICGKETPTSTAGQIRLEMFDGGLRVINRDIRLGDVCRECRKRWEEKLEKVKEMLLEEKEKMIEEVEDGGKCKRDERGD